MTSPAYQSHSDAEDAARPVFLRVQAHRIIPALSMVWASGAAVGLFLAEFLQNNLDFTPRRSLDTFEAMVLVLLAAPAILAAIWLAWSGLLAHVSGQPIHAALVMDARTYLPLLLLGSLPILSRVVDAPLTSVHAVIVLSVTVTAIMLAGAKVLVEGAAIGADWRRLLASPVWVVASAILFVVVAGALVLARYQAHNYWGIDLAQFDQALWNTWRGRILAFTQYSGLPDTLLTDHFEPIMLLFAPLYLIWPDPRTLLLVQVVALAAGSWLVYRLGQRHLVAPFAAVCVGLAYLAHPAIMGNALDAGASFRPDLLTIPLFLGVLLALEDRRWGIAVLLTVLAMACKEYIAAVVVMLGLYVVYRYRRLRLGFGLSALGMAWLVVVLGVYLPMVRGGAGSIHFSLNLGHVGGDGGASGIISTFFADPARFSELLASPADLFALLFALLSLAFLPVLHPALTLVGLPVVAMFALVATPDLFDFHLAPALPFAFTAAIIGIANLARWAEGHTRFSSQQLHATGGAALLAAALATSFFLSGGPLGVSFWNAGRPYHFWRTVYPRDAHDAQLDALLLHVPPDEPVLASDFTLPRLSQRPQVYHFFDPPPEDLLRNVRYAVIDLFEVHIPPPEASLRRVLAESADAVMPHIAGRALYSKLLTGGEYSVDRFEDGLLLLRRIAPGESKTGYHLAVEQVTTASPVTSVEHAFDDRLRLLGYDLSEQPVPGQRQRITYYWEVLDGYTAPFTFRYGINPQDHVQARTDQYVLIDTFTVPGQDPFRVVHVPTFLMLPPAEWQPGMILREEIEFELPANWPAGAYDWQLGLYVVPEHFGIASTPDRLLPDTQPMYLHRISAPDQP